MTSGGFKFQLLSLFIFGSHADAQLYCRNHAGCAMSEAEMLEIIPLHRSERCQSISHSPAIDYSQSDAPKVGEGNIWTWDISEPVSLFETHSRTTFPNSAYTQQMRMFETVDGAAEGDFRTATKSITVPFTIGNYPDSVGGINLEFCLSWHQHNYLFYKDQGLMYRLAAEYSASDASTEPYAYRVLKLLNQWAHNYDSYELVYYVGTTLSYIYPTVCSHWGHSR